MARRLLPLLIILGLVAPPMGATTYTMPTDADLADQAPLIVQAIIVASEPAPIPGPPSTDYFVQIERVIKGYVAGSTIVVRVLGGIGTDGIGLRIWGAPSFRLGERALLFLTPRTDGTYAILHLMLGAFHEVQFGENRLALRDLSEALEAWRELADPVPAGDGVFDGPRDFEAFVDWLSGRVRGEFKRPDYVVNVGGIGLPVAASALTLLEDRCTGLGFRWFDFDQDKAVSWRVHGRRADRGRLDRVALEQAQRAWRDASGGQVQLSFATAATESGSGLAAWDSTNDVLFGDTGDWVAGSFGCSAGGLLAISGLWYDNGRNQECHFVDSGEAGVFRDHSYLRILGADIVTNDGAACFFAGNLSGLAEVLAHELGHTLGLSHIAVVDSLMRGQVHDDGRGPDLDPVDREALGLIYGLPE